MISLLQTKKPSLVVSVLKSCSLSLQPTSPTRAIYKYTDFLVGLDDSIESVLLNLKNLERFLLVISMLKSLNQVGLMTPLRLCQLPLNLKINGSLVVAVLDQLFLTPHLQELGDKDSDYVNYLFIFHNFLIQTNKRIILLTSTT